MAYDENVSLDERLQFCIGHVYWLDATTKPLEACLEQLVDIVKGRPEHTALTGLGKAMRAFTTVFICYAQSDKDIADKVCSTLESREIKCWIAPRDVPPGEPYAHVIVEAIREAKVVVLVLSPAANDSKYVINEVEAAANKGIPIVPLQVENVSLDERFSKYVINEKEALEKLKGKKG